MCISWTDSSSVVHFFKIVAQIMLTPSNVQKRATPPGNFCCRGYNHGSHTHTRRVRQWWRHDEYRRYTVHDVHWLRDPPLHWLAVSAQTDTFPKNQRIFPRPGVSAHLHTLDSVELPTWDTWSHQYTQLLCKLTAATGIDSFYSPHPCVGCVVTVLYSICEEKGYPCNGPWRPTGLWDVEVPIFSK
jgi:hypothetical protein